MLRFKSSSRFRNRVSKPVKQDHVTNLAYDRRNPPPVAELVPQDSLEGVRVVGPEAGCDCMCRFRIPVIFSGIVLRNPLASIRIHPS